MKSHLRILLLILRVGQEDFSMRLCAKLKSMSFLMKHKLIILLNMLMITFMALIQTVLGSN
ncbi:hypothetical protein D3C72_2117660 [compost metagenome]